MRIVIDNDLVQEAVVVYVACLPAVYGEVLYAIACNSEKVVQLKVTKASDAFAKGRRDPQVFTGSIWDLSWVAEWLLQALITTIAGNKSSRMLNDIIGLGFC